METLLILIFVLLAWCTKPEALLDFDDQDRRVEIKPGAAAYITWALVCIAMIAGLVVVALVGR